MMRLLGVLAGLFVGALMLFMVWGLVYFMPMDLRGESRCAALGYPGHKTTYTTTIYCIKRVNQTDVMARLDTLQ